MPMNEWSATQALNKDRSGVSEEGTAPLEPLLADAHDPGWAPTHRHPGMLWLRPRIASELA
jgi:hypothetical protein